MPWLALRYVVTFGIFLTLDICLAEVAPISSVPTGVAIHCRFFSSILIGRLAVVPTVPFRPFVLFFGRAYALSCYPVILAGNPAAVVILFTYYLFRTVLW